VYPGDQWLESSPLYGALIWLAGRRVVVRNASMYPLLRPGDRVVIDPLAYRIRAPRRGEIALGRRRGVDGGLVIKIVAGMPGERLRVTSDRFWIDDRALDLWGPVVGAGEGQWTLGPREYFLLSYSLAVGADSRQFGPLPRSELVGPATRIACPTERRRRLGPVIPCR
jgi:signal peptidase I